MQPSETVRLIRNVVVKALLLFAVLNGVFALLYPVPLGKLSGYNHLFRGRERFPFGENPQQTYNLSLYDVDAMFAAHTLSGAAKAANEYRVLVLGDSSVWGTLLRPEETLSGQINAAQLTTCGGKQVRAYNLGYPTISLTKDLMLMQEALRYQPDLILWPMTLESLPRDKQLASPLAANNPQRVQALIDRYGLANAVDSSALVRPNFAQRTVVGQRRVIFDWLRLQLYGVMWSATGVDQLYPADYERAQTDLEADEQYHTWLPPHLPQDQLALDVLRAGHAAVGDVPLVMINEPMLISTGKNSSVRYNFFYPRWAYDDYRQILADLSRQEGWQYVDLWDAVPADQFTNSAIHLTPQGSALFAQRVGAVIEQAACHP